MKLKEKVNEGQIYRLIDLNGKIILGEMPNREKASRCPLAMSFVELVNTKVQTH
jgi:hypothetical protein